jgi:hypothetical protein
VEGREADKAVGLVRVRVDRVADSGVWAVADSQVSLVVDRELVFQVLLLEVVIHAAASVGAVGVDLAAAATMLITPTTPMQEVVVAVDAEPVDGTEGVNLRHS